MEKFLILALLGFFGSCVLSEPLKCCKCSNGEYVDVSNRECRENNTCQWTCSTKKKCGPDLFLDPYAKEGAPNVTSNFWKFTAWQGVNYDISCEIRSNPEANVTWLFNGTDIRSDESRKDRFTKRRSQTDCNAVLTFNALKGDNGRLTCLAQNAKGSASHTVDLNVKWKEVIKPHVIDFDIDTENHKAYLGTTFNLSCTVNFNPSIMGFRLIVFLRNGSRVRDKKGKYENFPQAVVNSGLITYKLSVKNATKAEEGQWSCYGSQNQINGNQKHKLVEIDPCPAGYYCPSNESKTRECPYGTYSDGSTDVTYQCTKCPGEYSTKPIGFSGPAKSIEECPKKDKPGLTPVAVVFIVFISIIAVVVTLLLVIIKYKKQCKRFLRKFMSVKCLVSEPELVCNDYCERNSLENLFKLASECPEFPIQYDVFISYSSKDVTFATEIQRELESQGFKCCIHIRDFIPGDTIVNNISNAIYGSRVTLAILSPDFVESEWCKGELQQALTRSMRDHRVIPIVYKKCEIPMELLHRTYIDYENCDAKPYFWDQLNRVLSPIKSTLDSNV